MSVAFIDGLGAFGTRPALIAADGGILTYADLAALIAARRHEMGGARRLIFWDAAPDVAGIATYLAALAGGHPIVPLPPACGAEGNAARRRLLDLYRPDLVVTADGDRWHCRPETPDPAPFHPDLALLLSTSGSTGSPKLVRLGASGIDCNAVAIGSYLGLGPDDCTALVLPLSYSYGLSVLHAHLAAGAGIYLGHRSILDPGFLDALARHGCTNLSGVPYSFELLEQIDFRTFRLPRLRFLTVAGGRLSPDMVVRYAQHMKRASGRFFVMYGQTEATARMAYLPPDAAALHPDCIGIALPGGELSLRDEDGRHIEGAGRVGELIYRGPNVMMGYADDRADLARGRDIPALATGDLAERNDAGFYRLVGRRQRFSKIAGLRIGHDAVELALMARGVTAAVTGDDRRLLVGLDAAAQLDPVRTSVARLTGLPPKLIDVRQLPDLPRGANGKTDYARLRDFFAETAPAARIVPGHAGAVMSAFADVFAPRTLRGSDSFARVGGDSLSYVEMTLALKPLIDPLPRDWEQLSIDRLSALAAARSPGWERRAFTGLDSDLFLRAIAILAVVLHHATRWDIAGGAAILLMLLGYNLARHQGARLLRGDVLATLRACLRPILLYYALLLIYGAFAGGLAWQNLLLVGNLGLDGYSTVGTPLVTFWFVEVYAQFLVFTALLFAFPRVRAAVRANPFASGLIGLGAAVALRPTVDLFLDFGEMRYFFTPRIVHVALLGWCIYFADTGIRRAIMAGIVLLLLIGLPLFEGTAGSPVVWIRAGLLAPACLLLLSGATPLLPRPIAAGLASVAAASFSIYLLHTWPYFLWLEDAGFAMPAEAFLYMIIGTGLGLLCHWSLRSARRSLLIRTAANAWISAFGKIAPKAILFSGHASSPKDAA
ncbi:AMP-binding protein [Dongia sp.]|uniref:AMP-binding protein n=1 Tax=Dongia sp. TaxID=1977262 RepID=UPI0035AE032B